MGRVPQSDAELQTGGEVAQSGHVEAGSADGVILPASDSHTVPPNEEEGHTHANSTLGTVSNHVLLQQNLHVKWDFP